MRILLTGSNGFLGCRLKKYFLEESYLLDLYARESSYYEILKVDKEYDLIVNAASATPINCKKDLIMKSNVINTSRLCNIALKCRAKYFINICNKQNLKILDYGRKANFLRIKSIERDNK